MSKPETEAPPKVMSALETLERATAPTDLGAAYKIVLDWRSNKSRSFGLRLYQVGSVLLFLAALFLLSRTEFAVSEYWRGATFGATVVLLLAAIKNWSSRRSSITMTFVERVDEAIDRWRHAVPAMRDFPK